MLRACDVIQVTGHHVHCLVAGCLGSVELYLALLVQEFGHSALVAAADRGALPMEVVGLAQPLSRRGDEASVSLAAMVEEPSIPSLLPVFCRASILSAGAV